MATARGRWPHTFALCRVVQVVTDFCSEHLERNKAAFKDPRLTLINDDARTQLEAVPDASFDIIIGDLADPLDGGPCYQLYTQVRAKGQPGGRPGRRLWADPIV